MLAVIALFDNTYKDNQDSIGLVMWTVFHYQPQALYQYRPSLHWLSSQ